MYIPTLFVCWRDNAQYAATDDLAKVRNMTQGVAGLTRALAFVPTAVASDQPYAADGRGPALTLELRFTDALALEAAASADGLLANLIADCLAGSDVDAQAFLARDFETPDPEFRLAPGGHPCTFLVEYPGTCADPAAWVEHYDAHHPPIMIRFPEIREVATFRPAPEIALGLPCLRARSMQRNKVVFDSGEALAAALASSVLNEMRADSAKFMQVTERPTHFPNATLTLV